MFSSQMLQALLNERENDHPPGSASALGPTMPMRVGAALNPVLERVQDIFPKDNPYGSFIERLIVGDSPDRTRNMKEGIPHQYTGAGPNDPIIRPQIVDLAAALPIGSAFKLAKLAAPLAVPTAMVTGAAALNRLKAPGYDATSTDDIASALLGQRLQDTGRLDNLMVNKADPSNALPEELAELTGGDSRTAISFDEPDQMGFRSVVSDVVDLESFPNSGTAEQMEAALGQKGGLSNQLRGQIGNLRIDKEELKFLGITDLLDEAKRTGQPVTRQQLQNSIHFNRDKLNLTEDELLDIDPDHPDDPINIDSEVIPFEDAEGQDYISSRIDDWLVEQPEDAARLAKNPDAEDEIRQEIYNLLEDNYNQGPTERIRLRDSDIYAMGSDDMGWAIRKGGNNWDDSEILTSSGSFVDSYNARGAAARQVPMNINSESEARLQLEELGRELELITSPGDGATQFRDYVAEDYSLGNIGDVTNYREFVVRLPEEAGGDIGSHFGDDVAYHMRVSDRDLYNENYITDGGKLTEKALYVDEIQSDYAQAGAGRKLQLKPEEEAILSNVDMDKKELKLALSNFVTNEAKQARHNLLVLLGNIQDRNKLLVQQGKIGPHFEDIESAPVRKLQSKLMGRQGSWVKEQPLVAGKEKWVQHAIKNLITRMVNEDKDRLIFTSGKNQAEHWKEEGLEYFYDTKVRKEIADVLKGIDKDAIEMIDGDTVSTRIGSEGETQRVGTISRSLVGDWEQETLQHVSIKNTQKIKDFIKGVGDKPKGFGAYSAAPVAVGAGSLLNADNDDEKMRRALLRN
jgi:hypothetical protein